MLTETEPKAHWMTAEQAALNYYQNHGNVKGTRFEYLYEALGVNSNGITLRVITPRNPTNWNYYRSIPINEADSFAIALDTRWLGEEKTFQLRRDWNIVNIQLLHNTDRWNNRHYPFIITVEVNGDNIPIIFDNFKWAETMLGIGVDKEYHFTYKGQTFPNTTLRQTMANFNFTTRALSDVRDKCCIMNDDSLRNLLWAKLAELPKIPEIKPAGAGKLYAKLLPLTGELAKKDPLAFCWFRTFCENCKRTINSVKVSAVFNADLANVETVDQFIEALQPLLRKADDESRATYSYRYWYARDFDAKLENFPTYNEKRKAAIKATSHRAFSKLMQEYEFLNLDEKKFPRLKKAIENGDLPLGIFFRKKEQYFLLNDNFELWEKMLKLWPKETVEIAATATKRTTYEKDLMSYFYFILYALPEYLKRHTKKKWTCVPKLVDSPSELSPPADDGTGTVRRRSALTPIVDNEANTVVVPYASLAMPGRQTTYCYSLTYNVLYKGLSFNGNTVTVDIEEKLNGKDDYGLMFYTLTGSEQGRGYPTFLIIFERLQDGSTRVHFHRTHPCRSKEGDYNPIHNWTKVCYNWMAGNVNKGLIRYQQGDLCFIEDDKEREYTQQVTVYDNHCFLTPVDYAPYELKKRENILGYVKLDRPTTLGHNEHVNIEMQPGRYIIRQCRSWEANPQGVWSLRID